MNGRLIWVSWTDESSIFAFSAASLRRWMAILSLDRSTPSVSLKVFTNQSMTFWSQSSPPRCVLPDVDLTSKTPSPISSTGDVEGPTAEVEHEHGTVLVLLVETVGQGGGGGLVDDPQDLEPGDLARLLRGGPLRVVEVRRYGDHRLVDRVTQVGLRVALQLAENPSRDLLRRCTACRRYRWSMRCPCGASPIGSSARGS